MCLYANKSYQPRRKFTCTIDLYSQHCDFRQKLFRSKTFFPSDPCANVNSQVFSFRNSLKPKYYIPLTLWPLCSAHFSLKLMMAPWGHLNNSFWFRKQQLNLISVNGLILMNKQILLVGNGWKSLGHGLILFLYYHLVTTTLF